MKLLTGAPGWSTSADVIVIGSGVAGLTTALNLRSYGLSVLLVTKARIDAGSTKWAQGGIAAALGVNAEAQVQQRRVSAESSASIASLASSKKGY